MDCARNIITANFSGGGTSATTAPLWQWDYGQVLCITGIDLPAAFEVHFSTNRTGGVSTVAVGADGQVTIPNDLLTIGKNLNAWIYLSDAQGEGETEYSILIPVKSRPMPETYDAEVSGEFDDVVRQVSEYAQIAQTAADNAGASASAAAASASEAAASASAAETAKNAAETAQGKAEDAQAAAETAAQTATQKAQQTAQDAAQAAQSKADAESAAGRAEAAQTGAESAKTDAETAAQGAADSASAASVSATSAGQAATSAAQSATAAAGSAASIEGDVQIASQKAAEAEAAANQAVAAKDSAQTAQQGAETAETNAGQSASTASTKAAEAAQSASNAADSETAAEAAATRAETAAASLTVDDALSDSSVNPVQNNVITESVTRLKSAINDVKAEVSATADVVTATGHASSRYRWQNNTLAIVSSGLYDITKLVPLEGCSGFSVDYSLTPNAGNGHAPICFFSSTAETTANLINHIDTVVANHVYTIPTGAKYVGFMVPTGTHPTVTLHTSKINIIENAVAKLEENGYGCAFPISDLRQTVGIAETFYYNTAITPNKTTYGLMSVGGDYSVQAAKGLTLPNETALEAINGFVWRMYNPAFVEIANYLGASGYGGSRHIVAENLSDCSLLAIGDSTVDSDTLTASLLSHFAEQGCTLTLLGTLGDGSGTNRNEGRSGWKASDYLTDKKYSGVTNPFYNPSSQTFDFAYYMTNQGYSAPTFVIIQLGINDLSAGTAKEDIWSCIQTMIDSILDYNSSIKILLNLPTTPNSDQSKMFATLSLYWNRVVRYNQYAQARAKALYAESSVRCSYCHLILDADEDIRDAVHPKSVGYEKMALEVVNQINCWQNGA